MARICGNTFFADWRIFPAPLLPLTQTVRRFVRKEFLCLQKFKRLPIIRMGVQKIKSQGVMSFVFSITLASEDALSRHDLKRWHPTDLKVEMRLRTSMFSKRGNVLFIGTRTDGSHGLLTDNADPDAEYWDIKAELLPDLVTLLKVVRKHIKSCFIVKASWVGEYSTKPVRISVEELGKLIEQGKISTKAHFLVC